MASSDRYGALCMTCAQESCTADPCLNMPGVVFLSPPQASKSNAPPPQSTFEMAPWVIYPSSSQAAAPETPPTQPAPPTQPTPQPRRSQRVRQRQSGQHSRQASQRRSPATHQQPPHSRLPQQQQQRSGPSFQPTAQLAQAPHYEDQNPPLQFTEADWQALMAGGGPPPQMHWGFMESSPLDELEAELKAAGRCPPLQHQTTISAPILQHPPVSPPFHNHSPSTPRLQHHSPGSSQSYGPISPPYNYEAPVVAPVVADELIQPFNGWGAFLCASVDGPEKDWNYEYPQGFIDGRSTWAQGASAPTY